MATVTARYTNPNFQINLTPHPDYGNGFIAQTPGTRLAILEEYIGSVAVTSSQMVATSKTGQKIYFSGTFAETFETTNFREAINRGVGVITGLTDTMAEDTSALRMTISDISFDAREFLTNTTWSSMLAGNDQLNGGPGGDVLVDLAGKNLFVGGGGNDVSHGGSGIDTAVFQGNLNEYQLATAMVSYSNLTNLNGRSVTDEQIARDGKDLLVGIERLQFADLNLALDTAKGEIAGSAYRIYKAAFDRTPDAGGLGFWINAMDDGASLTSVAAGFISSPEFKQLYGANVTDRDFVTKVYSNVLDRNPDQSGYDFWLGAIGRGATRADILASFSESPENIGNVADLIANGIQYQEWLA